jgi:hypothetical protein
MKKIKTNNRYVPSYENGSHFGEISKFLRSQMASYKPMEVPKGFAGGSYALQGGALSSQILGLLGQRPEETPYVANPSDVSGAFQKNNIGSNISLLDNFFLGQQQALARSVGSQGGSVYDTANILAKPIGDAARVRSESVLNLVGQNNELDRNKSAFAIEEGNRINQSLNTQRTNENQKIALLGGKLAEGAGAFSNLNNQVFMNKQQVDFINNSKSAQMMNQLLTAKFYESLYKKNG